MGDEGVERYKGYGIDLEGASGETHHLLPVPAVYIVDKKGKILFEYVNPDHRVRIDAQTVLAAAQAQAR
jgi:peroxiredoxin